MTQVRLSATSRRSLLLGTALAALAALPGTAHGQAFNGSPSTQAGSVTYNRANPDGAGTERITINSPQAVIAWTLPTPPPGPFVFLPAGNTARFQGGAGNANFAVLNRIVNAGSSTVVLNGSIISQISAADTTRGGTVAFFTPNGLVIGATAVIDVGNLVLTTLDPVFQATGEFITPGGAITFQNNISLTNTSITTLAGSQISANQEGSYIIFAAPQITHGGSVRVNGSVAYAAVGGATITHNAGLFDIQVAVGTTVGTPLVHTGSTTGPASTGAADTHNIVMRAVSDTQAITALVSGQVGYDAPLSATVENGAIIISAQVRNSPPGGAQIADLQLTDGNYTSDVLAESSHDATVAGNVTFTQDLTLAGARNTTMLASAGETISVGGNLLMTSESSQATGLGIDRTGGNVSMTADPGGTITVTGNATIAADGIGQVNLLNLNQIGNGTGGSATVQANGGAIQIGGNLSISANGGTASGNGPVPTSGGTGLGGTAIIGATTGGTVNVAGGLSMTANGTAATTTGAGPVAPTGTGGSIRLLSDGGAITITGPSTLSAIGTGGNLTGGGRAGLGTGGRTFIFANNSGTIDLTAGLDISVRGSGGLGPAGGDGVGGGAEILATAGGRVSSPGATSIDANGVGQSANGIAQNGGAGTGGLIFVRASTETGPLARVELGNTSLFAQGVGGAGGGGVGAPSPVNPGNGGDATGGTILVAAESSGGRLTVASLLADAQGLGGTGGAPGSTGLPFGDGGDATGGTIDAGVVDTEGTLGTTAQAIFGVTTLNAGAVGGRGNIGGAATGGTASLRSDGGLGVTVNGLAMVSASATGGDGATAGSGTGGTAAIDASAGGIITTDGAIVEARGSGGNIDPDSTTAGAGQGGTARISAIGGGSRVNVNGNIDVDASGQGGFSGLGILIPGQTAGSGTGGTASIGATGGGVVTGADASVLANGSGGRAASAGAGTGGTAFVSASGGGSQITLANATVRTDGGAGQIGPSGGANSGGNSLGGQASVTAGPGATVRIGGAGAGNLIVTARALQSVTHAASSGSSAQGGTARINALGGSIQVGLDALVDAGAAGGAGVDAGGNATGGTAEIASGGAALGLPAGTITIGGTAQANADAIGGDGVTTGGVGQGGTARVVADGGAITATTGAQLSANGIGGAGASGGAGRGGTAALISTATSPLTLGQTSLAANGTGGIGVFNGGAGTGGTVQVNAAAAVQLGGLNAQASAFGGDGGGSGAAGNAQAGTVALTIASGGALNVAGASTIEARARGGNGANGGNATGGGVTIATAAGGQTAFAGQLGISVSAGSPVGAATGNAGTVAIQANGATGFGGLNIAADAEPDSTGAGGTVTIGGPAGVTYGNAAITALGRGATPTAGGIQIANMTGAPGGSNLSANTHGPLTATAVTAAQNITLTATNGPLNATNVNAGGALAIATTTGPLNATNVRGGVSANLTTGTGALTANGVTGGNLTLTTGGGTLNATNVNGTGAVSLSSGTGNLTAGNITAGTTATLATTTGALNATGVTGPAIALTTGSGAIGATNLNATQTISATSTSGAVNLTGAAAGQSITVATGNVVTLNGAIAAPAVNVDSQDIVISAGANVGGPNAQVRLAARPSTNPTTFGGTGQGPGYTLDAAEANRIQGASLTLFAPATGVAPNRPADLVVRDVTLDGGRLTALRLQSPGIVQVNGNLLLANGGTGHAITIDGTSPAQRVMFVTPGSVRLRDAAGAPAGTVTVDARDIWIADASMISQLAANRDFAGRDVALLAPSATFAPRGYLEGQNVVLRPTESLFTQNSGTFAAFGGITVSGNLTIIGGGASGEVADVYAFGRRIDPAGDSTGTPFFFQVTFGGQFTNASDFNTCIINPRACPGGGKAQTSRDLDGSIDGEDEGEGGPGTLPSVLPNDDLINEAALAEPLIEEPVTSGGDSGAWTDSMCSSDAAPDGGGSPCPDQSAPAGPAAPAEPTEPAAPVPGQRP